VDKAVAESAEKALKRHLWYLTEELAVLSLFSSKITSHQKDKISEKLLSIEPEERLVSPSMYYILALLTYLCTCVIS
jgi:hypothetical protein